MSRRFVPIALAALFLALPLLAQSTTETRAERQQLVRELLKVIDSKRLTQSMLDLMFDRMLGASETMQPSDASIPKDKLEKVQAQRKKAQEQMRVFRERLYARVDFATYDDQVYAPLFEKTYSAAELRELIAFFKTKAGQKTSALLPDISLGAFMKGSELLNKDATAVREELRAEEEARKPQEEKTMSDLRTVATALEARATDTNDYPKVASYSDLKPILSPTYIRNFPEKDGWGTAYRYSASTDGQHYRLVSAGSDHQFEGGSDMVAMFDEKSRPPVIHSPSLASDIIYQDGGFVQAPATAAERMDSED
jgi:hypothetical protein